MGVHTHIMNDLRTKLMRRNNKRLGYWGQAPCAHLGYFCWRSIKGKHGTAVWGLAFVDHHNEHFPLTITTPVSTSTRNIYPHKYFTLGVGSGETITRSNSAAVPTFLPCRDLHGSGQTDHGPKPLMMLTNLMKNCVYTAFCLGDLYLLQKAMGPQDEISRANFFQGLIENWSENKQNLHAMRVGGRDAQRRPLKQYIIRLSL